MNASVDPYLATIFSGIGRLLADIGDSGAQLLKNDGRQSVSGVCQEVVQAATILEKGPNVPVFALAGLTGVGKSSLLNAILHEEAAASSWRRPTTIAPLLHHHVSQPMDELHRMMPGCACSGHEAVVLKEKMFVDLPDPFCVSAAAAEDVSTLLGQADVVICVATPERFSDQSLWELIQKHSGASAFAFVLNKCQAVHGVIGKGPGSDWLEDLGLLGFANPMLFQFGIRWDVEQVVTERGSAPFQKFCNWVSRGIQGKALEYVRRRRLTRTLTRLAEKIEAQGLSETRLRWRDVEKEWVIEIHAEAGHLSETVMEGLDRRSDELEGFLEADLRDRLRGIMALWLRLFGRGRSGGGGILTGGWRSILGQLALGARESTNRRDQASKLALEPAIDGSGADRRRRDLMDRLAGRVIDHELPVESVLVSFRTLAEAPWRDPLLAQARSVLDEFEGRRLASGGVRGLIRDLCIGLANYLPPLGLLGILSWPVILFFDPMGWKRTPQWFDLFLPVMGLVLMLMGLQALLGLVMPFQWPAIRAELRQRLRLAKAFEMEREYLGILTKNMAEMEEKGKRLLDLAARARDLAHAAEPSLEEFIPLESLFARPVPTPRR